MKRTLCFFLIMCLIVSMFTISPAVYAEQYFAVVVGSTLDNLLASVQGESSATAAYRAFAEKAYEEGYDAIARLFLATADAEAKHAEDEWAIAQAMGATVRPAADVPVVGTTAENLKTAFDGETYEYIAMYPEFLEVAKAEGMTAAARIFEFALEAETVHAANYDDVLKNLGNATYINANYGVVYRCPVCGEVSKERPGRCPICGNNGANYAMYNQTYFNLLAAVHGESSASAAYSAFALKAKEDGYAEVYRLFEATSDAEAKHANDEWELARAMGASVRPAADVPVVGTTAENLQTAFDGETYEYKVMYPEFLDTAKAEGMTAAARIFEFALEAETVHAGNYDDVLKNLSNATYIKANYSVVYRCPVCGEVSKERPGRCPICGNNGANYVMYNQTYFNLLAAVHGESSASAAYSAFAQKAKEDGYAEVYRLFEATSDAEAKHANDEWELARAMGASVRPAADVPVVGTTAENLQTAFDGETYEYKVMYPEFLDTAKAEGMTAAARIFEFALEAETVHAGNYDDVLKNLSNATYIKANYSVVYRCPVCGEVSKERPGRCPICGNNGANYVMYSFSFLTYACDGQPIGTLDAAVGKTLDIDILLTTNDIAAESVAFFAALYDKDGRMVSIVNQNLALANTGFETVSLSVPINEEGMSLKTFIWDGMTFAPLITEYLF